MRNNHCPNPDRRSGFNGYVIRMRCFNDRVVTDPHAFLNVNAAPAVQLDAKASGPRRGARNILKHAILESRDKPLFAHTFGDSDSLHSVRNAVIVCRSMKILRIWPTISIKVRHSQSLGWHPAGQLPEEASQRG